MKYMFICERLSIQVPPEKWLEMLQETKKWINKRIEDGTIESIYNFIDTGGVVIANFDSHEAARDYFAEFPIGSSYEWQIKALVDHKNVIDGAIARLKKATKKKE